MLRPLYPHAAQKFAEAAMAWFHADFEASISHLESGALPAGTLELRRSLESLQKLLIQENLLEKVPLSGDPSFNVTLTSLCVLAPIRSGSSTHRRC